MIKTRDYIGCWATLILANVTEGWIAWGFLGMSTIFLIMYMKNKET
tara:strand:+ start:1102 stop:1239 length:138 start_codon:yes stop_codon:yes gene_type:complete